MTREASNWEAKVGKHAYAGSCAPPGVGGVAQDFGGVFSGQHRFSVGIFQWVLLSSGKGVKRGPVKVRVVGYISDAHKIAEKAREVCQELDAGTYTGPKKVTVK